MTGISTIKFSAKHAIAIFAKLPRAGQVKTRLAKETSDTFATNFYKLCLEQITSVFNFLNSEQDIDIYWALPDGTNSAEFSFFKTIYQGHGHLGIKLTSIQSQLFNMGYKRVTLIGSDSPHITHEQYICFHQKTKNDNHCYIGPTEDGGFYLFSTTHPTKDAFLATRYSESTTCSELTKNLNTNNIPVIRLKKDFDIDIKNDLNRLREKLMLIQKPTKIEKKMINHITLKK